jgi:NADH-quinone oxidoreductase subunit G
VFFNKEGFFRVKPVFNEKVNGHWMCDEGRDLYKFVNRDHRLLKGAKKSGSATEEGMPGATAKDASSVVAASKGKLALVLTGQYSVEEYEAVVGTFKTDLGCSQIFHWINNPGSFESFDGILLRGDRNPNTKGLLQTFEKHQITASWADLEKGISNGDFETIVVAGPENQTWYPDFAEKMNLLGKAKNLIWMQTGKNPLFDSYAGNLWLIPMKSYVEKDGTFINHNGIVQTFRKVTTVVSEALSLSEAAAILAKKPLMIRPDSNPLVEADRPSDRVTLENRKKNEFVFHRGSL